MSSTNGKQSNQEKYLDSLVEKLSSEIKWAKLQTAFDEVFAYVKQCDLRMKDVSHYIEFFDVDHLPKSQSLLATQHLRDLGIVQVAQSALELQQDDLFADPLDSNVAQFMSVLWNATNHCPEMCRAVHESKIHLQFLKLLNNPVLNLENVEKREIFCKPLERVRSILSIAYNVMRKIEESRVCYRNDGFIEASASYMSTSITSFKLDVLSAIIFLVDLDSDEGKRMIQTCGLTIKFLVDVMLRQALEDPDNDVDGVSNSPGELLETLNNLAVNVDNAKEMFKLGVPRLCVDIVNEFGEASHEDSDQESEDKDNDDDEDDDDELDEEDQRAFDSEDEEIEIEKVQWALKLLWSLSFVEKIEQLSEVTEKLVKLKDHPDQEVSSGATGLLFSTNKRPESNKENSIGEVQEPKQVIGNQLMLSYCWAQKETVWKLAESLKKSGAQIWLDKEQMHKGQDTLEEMAKAVEISNVIIICYSENYKESLPCRMEAKYATKLKKNLVFVNVQRDYEPLGWLGFLLGTSFRFDVFDNFNFDSNFPKLIAQIREVSSDRSIQVAHNLNSKPALPAADEIDSGPKTSSQISHWSCEDVNRWFSNVGLVTLADSLTLNGRDLEELKRWQKHATSYFLKFCENKLNMKDATELLLFSRELRAI